MAALRTMREGLGDERGAVTLTFALAFPFFVAFLAVVLTAGDWWVHSRHLQTQADAAALAAAQDYNANCTSLQTRMESVVGDYGGTRNPQVEGTQGNVHFVVNKPDYYAGGNADDTPAADPCDSQMVDVKATETGLKGPIGVGLIPTINAHARVSFFKAKTLSGMLPIAVPEPAPRHVHAYFINESDGSAIADRELLATGKDANGNTIWDNAGSPLSVNVGSKTRIGVRIALSGQASTTCGDPLVDCYDAGSANGLVFIRGYAGDTPANQTANRPQARGVTLSSSLCDPYFSTSTATCNVAVHANVDFGTGNNDPRAAATANPPGVKAALQAVVNGTTYPMTWSNGTWDSLESIPIAPGAGPVSVDLQWAEQVGSITGLGSCSTGSGNNPFKNNNCVGTIANVQRSFGGNDARSGPIKLIQILQGGKTGANSFRQCDSQNSSCTPSLVVRLSTQASLENAASATSPVVTLRTGDQNQTQALDCDDTVSNLKDEIVKGCSPSYTQNLGTACPDSKTTLWASTQPWNCVAISTGTATNQIASGLNERILGNASATTCTAPNRFATEFANGWDRSDPRIISVILVPFGVFSGSGSGTVPVLDFATFYITGWAGQGQGFNNPCSATDDDPGGKGNIVGHFISYTQLQGTPSTDSCDPLALTPCLGVLTR
jgi:hypothetical protein